jgi:hypothetical protein
MTRERADFVLDNIATQVERVRNNSARRRLRRALEKAKAKRALQVFRSAHPPVAGDDLVRVPFDVGVR